MVVCEDDPGLRSIIGTLVTEAGHVVIAETDNASDARRLAADFLPDVVVADLIVAGTSNLLRELDVEGRTWRIVVFSAVAEQVSTALPGVIAVQKPDFERLRSVLAELAVAEDRPAERRRSRGTPLAVRRSSPWDEPRTFYEALQAVKEGETLVMALVRDRLGTDEFAAHCRRVVRQHDLMLRRVDGVVLLLDVRDEATAARVVERIRAEWPDPDEITMWSKEITAGTAGVDVFSEMVRVASDRPGAA
ncbi:MAG: hypothetical protein NVS3B21_14710 [Acidimicrobiales bacterium]